MHDASYVLAGYALTGATLALYRLQLARRARRARSVVSALTGRSAAPRRARR